MSGPLHSGPFTWIRNQDLLQAALKVQSPTRNKRKSRRPKTKNKFQNKTMSPSTAAGPHVMSRKLGRVGPCAGGLCLVSTPPHSPGTSSEPNEAEEGQEATSGKGRRRERRCRGLRRRRTTRRSRRATRPSRSTPRYSHTSRGSVSPSEDRGVGFGGLRCRR
jgi:hypothetical protein